MLTRARFEHATRSFVGGASLEDRRGHTQLDMADLCLTVIPQQGTTWRSTS
jgi:hypothetical protein